MLHGAFILATCEQQKEVDALEAGRPQELATAQVPVASLWDEEDG